MQATDWLTNLLIYVDTTGVLLIIYIYLLWRVCILFGQGGLFIARGRFHINQGYAKIGKKNIDNTQW
jgi:hypothetical protein